MSDILPSEKMCAIVLTDAVYPNGVEERRKKKVLRKRLRHHFMRMREFVGHWRGQVAKLNDGGMLIYFESALDAVSWALDLQNRIHVGNMELPSFERIQHRIGIHLGDTAGESVSIATHLQIEATPGGICISQAVHDALKTRMNLQTTSLGTRKFKDIREAVPLYKILLNTQPQTALPRDKTEDLQPKKSKIKILFLATLVILDILLLLFLRQHI